MNLKSNQKYVFLKVNRESHFISQGTVIKDAILIDVSEADKRIKNALAKVDQSLIYKGLPEKIQKDIADCLKVEGVDTSHLVIITKLDYDDTSPLANDINDLTKRLFTEEKWLAIDAGRKGTRDIKIGLALPSVPFSG